MERRNCALIMLKRVGGSQDMLICVPSKEQEHNIIVIYKSIVFQCLMAPKA